MSDTLVFVECKCNSCERAEKRTDKNDCCELYFCTKFRRLVTGNFFCKIAKKRKDVADSE